MVEVREIVHPPWPFRLRGSSPDGLLRRRGPALQRLLHHDGAPVLVGVMQPAADRVLFVGRGATEEGARWGIERMRFTTGVDEDLRAFHDCFRDDRYIGKAVRSVPGWRVWRRPEPWEALAWAITEQLIEFHRAVEIQRRLIRRLGRRCAHTGLWDMPAPAAVAGAAPAELAATDLAPMRAITMRRAARAISTLATDQERTVRRLRAIPGIGTWTMEMLALYGLGRYDKVPAGDLGYLELVGRLKTGNRRARAEEAEVREFFEPYGEWRGLAGEYLRIAASRGLLPS
jgi:3-methyladenine DNA glycosylase/8-oxoguanine DNA glycosylase